MKTEYNMKKVNTFNIILIIIFSSVLSFQVFALNGAQRGLMVLGATGFASIIAISMVLFKIPDNIVSIFLPMCPMVSGVLLMINDGGSSKSIIIIMATTAMAALYFNRFTLVVFGVVSNIFYLALNFILDLNVLGANVPSKEIITQLVMADISLVVMYFLTKWGNEYIHSAIENEQKTSQLLEDLEDIMNVLEGMAVNISDDLNQFRISIERNQKISDAVTTGMNEISKGVDEEAIALSTIAGAMNDVQQKVNITNSISNELERLSKDVNEVVKNNGHDIEEMSVGMKIINRTVEDNLSTVNELDASMDEITNFVNTISKIADQTNLLALNASIEATNAGEAGRGFTVVASEIRALSEGSHKVAMEIGGIVDGLRQKTKKALETSENGTVAVHAGNEILENLRTSISSMIISFGQIQKHIDDEYTALDEITRLFNHVQENLENNSAIMEEQAATTQEITNSVGDQNKSINEMVGTIKNIEIMGMELKNIAKRG